MELYRKPEELLLDPVELEKAIGAWKTHCRTVKPEGPLETDYFDFLADTPTYQTILKVNDRWWCASEQLMFHGSMIIGKIGDYAGHDFRYCYPNMNQAFLSQLEWLTRGFTGEPRGWHKRRSLPANVLKKNGPAEARPLARESPWEE